MIPASTVMYSAAVARALWSRMAQKVWVICFKRLSDSACLGAEVFVSDCIDRFSNVIIPMQSDLAGYGLDQHVLLHSEINRSSSIE